MSISFSGLGSGLPIDEWITALVKVEQDKVDALSTEKEALQKKQTALNTLKSEYSALETAATKLTDSLLGAGSDIFSKVSVSTSETSIVTATVTQYATPSKIQLAIDNLATASKRTSNQNDLLRDSSTKLSELGVTQNASFEINGATISVTPDTSIDTLIYKINNSSTADVKASLENGRIVLESKKCGQYDIEVKGDQTVDGTHTFAELLGFDQAANFTEGQRAAFRIDGGPTRYADSNTLTSEDTGILGLTVDLLTTTDKDPDTGADIPIDIVIEREPDSESVLTALQEFVDAFNKVIKDTDDGTDAENGGIFTGESSLINIRNNIRSDVTAAVSTYGIYRSLADIGITTGAIGTSVDADTNQLVIDKDAFIKAFEDDPSSVKALLVGDNTTGSECDGVMQVIKEDLKAALSASGGYFTARGTSLNQEISRMTEKINKKQEYVESYQAKLTKQFQYMDQVIAELNSQFSMMQQQLASIGVNVGNSSS